MIVVEVLGRRGDVVQSVKLERLPATIGRAFACDVIVADPLVDPRHAQLVRTETGGIVLEDLGSVNGLYLDGTREKTPRIAIEGVTPARIGRTRLRIARTDAAVAPAVPDVETGSAPLGRPGTALALLAAGFALALLLRYESNYSNHPATTAGGEALIVTACTLLWAGLWALIGRVNVQPGRFASHLGATWAFLIAAMVVAEVRGFVEFLRPGAVVFDALLTVTLFVVLPIVLLSHQLGLATLLSRRGRRLVAATITGAGLFLVVAGANLALEEFGMQSTPTITISASLLPLPARMIPAGSVEDFLRTTDGLKAEIDALK